MIWRLLLKHFKLQITFVPNGLFGKVRELFGIRKEYFLKRFSKFYMFGWFFVRVRENGKVNTLRIINKGLKELWGTKEYRKVWKLEVIDYFNNCFRISLNWWSKSLILCLDHQQLIVRLLWAILRVDHQLAEGNKWGYIVLNLSLNR